MRRWTGLLLCSLCVTLGCDDGADGGNGSDVDAFVGGFDGSSPLDLGTPVDATPDADAGSDGFVGCEQDPLTFTLERMNPGPVVRGEEAIFRRESNRQIVRRRSRGIGELDTPFPDDGTMRWVIPSIGGNPLCSGELVMDMTVWDTHDCAVNLELRMELVGDILVWDYQSPDAASPIHAFGSDGSQRRASWGAGASIPTSFTAFCRGGGIAKPEPMERTARVDLPGVYWGEYQGRWETHGSIQTDAEGTPLWPNEPPESILYVPARAEILVDTVVGGRIARFDLEYALTGFITVPRADDAGEARGLALLGERPITAETSSRQVYFVDVEPVEALTQVGEDGDAIVRLVTGHDDAFVVIVRRGDAHHALLYGADGTLRAERALAPMYSDLTRFRDGYLMVDSTGITHLDAQLSPIADPPWQIDASAFRANPSGIVWLEQRVP